MRISQRFGVRHDGWMRRRGWREGSVHRDRAAGGWVAVVSLGFREGKRIRHKARARTEREARQELERLLRLYAGGGDPATMTLDAYLNDWINAHTPNVKPSTARSYRDHIRLHISPLLGGIPVAKLRPADVRRLILERLQAGKSPATVGRIVTTLRIALGQAVTERQLTDNVAGMVKLPHVDREPVRPLSADDVYAIREAIRDDPLEALYLLLLGSGLRLGEACRLNWQDVNLERGTVYVSEGKTARSRRTVGMAGYALTALRLLKRDRGIRGIGKDDPIFLGPNTGKRLRATTASHAFPRLLRKAGLPPMRVHDLRHGTATRMRARGVDMRRIADQLGHAHPSMTANVYAHVLPDEMASATSVLDEDLVRNDPQIGSHGR